MSQYKFIILEVLSTEEDLTNYRRSYVYIRSFASREPRLYYVDLYRCVNEILITNTEAFNNALSSIIESAPEQYFFQKQAYISSSQFDILIGPNTKNEGNIPPDRVVDNIINVDEMEDNIEIMFSKISSIENKTAVFVFGNTGSGKSTLVNYLAGIPLHKDEDIGEIDVINKKSPHAEIGCAGSLTVFTEGFSDQDLEVSYCDTPGLLDSRPRPETQLTCAISFKLTALVAENLKNPLIVVGLDEVTAARGAVFKNLLRKVVAIFKSEKFDPVYTITKIPEGTRKKDIMTKLMLYYCQAKNNYDVLFGRIQEFPPENASDENLIRKTIVDEASHELELTYVLANILTGNDEELLNVIFNVYKKSDSRSFILWARSWEHLSELGPRLVLVNVLDKGATRQNIISLLKRNKLISTDCINVDSIYKKALRRFEDVTNFIASEGSEILGGIIKFNNKIIGLEEDIKSLKKKIELYKQEQSVKTLHAELDIIEESLKLKNNEIEKLKNKIDTNTQELDSLDRESDVTDDEDEIDVSVFRRALEGAKDAAFFAGGNIVEAFKDKSRRPQALLGVLSGGWSIAAVIATFLVMPPVGAALVMAEIGIRVGAAGIGAGLGAYRTIEKKFSYSNSLGFKAVGPKKNGQNEYIGPDFTDGTLNEIKNDKAGGEYEAVYKSKSFKSAIAKFKVYVERKKYGPNPLRIKNIRSELGVGEDGQEIDGDRKTLRELIEQKQNIENEILDLKEKIKQLKEGMDANLLASIQQQSKGRAEAELCIKEGDLEQARNALQQYKKQYKSRSSMYSIVERIIFLLEVEKGNRSSISTHFLELYESVQLLMQDKITVKKPKQEKLEQEYINSNPKLKQYYEALSSSLMKNFTGCMAVGSGMVENSTTSSQQNTVEKVALYSTNLIDYLAGSIPIVSHISSVVTTIASGVISVNNENRVKRFLALVPDHTKINKLVARACRIITIAFATKIKEMEPIEDNDLMKFLKVQKGRFIVDDVDTVYKAEAVAHAICIVKEAMNGNISPEVFCSDEIIKVLDPSADIPSLRAQRESIGIINRTTILSPASIREASRAKKMVNELLRVNINVSEFFCEAQGGGLGGSIIRGWSPAEGRVRILADGNCLFNSILVAAKIELPQNAIFSAMHNCMDLRAMIDPKFFIPGQHKDPGTDWQNHVLTHIFRGLVTMPEEHDESSLSGFKEELRDFIKSYRTRYLSATEEREKNEIWEEFVGQNPATLYLDSIKTKSSTWGSEIELQILAKVLGIRIILKYSELNSRTFNEEEAVNTITLAYNGNHYDVILSDRVKSLLPVVDDGVEETKDNHKNLRRTEKRLLVQNLNLTLLKQVVPQYIGCIAEQELEYNNILLKSNGTRSNIPSAISLIPETDHINQHRGNVLKLISQIDSGAIASNTIICLERKQYGDNLGMRDVILLAKIIEHNQKYASKSNRIKLPHSIACSPIYADAQLYIAAKNKGITVLGIEGEGLAHSKESPHYNAAREEYMANSISQITATGKNVIFLVGSAHILGLKERISTIERGIVDILGKKERSGFWRRFVAESRKSEDIIAEVAI